MKILRLSPLALLAVLALVLAGCTTTPSPSPAPTPKPTPPPTPAKYSQDCTPNQNDCDIDTQKIANEEKSGGPSHQCGAQFDPATALYIVIDPTKADPKNGKYASVNVTATDPDETFDLTFKPCDPKNKITNPFSNSEPKGKKNWKSGGAAKGVVDKMQYEMVLTRYKKGKKVEQKDPHIVFGG